MESLLNYLAFENKNEMVDLLPWETTDHWFSDPQPSKVNFNGLIMQLERTFFENH